MFWSVLNWNQTLMFESELVFFFFIYFCCWSPSNWQVTWPIHRIDLTYCNIFYVAVFFLYMYDRNFFCEYILQISLCTCPNLIEADSLHAKGCPLRNETKPKRKEQNAISSNTIDDIDILRRRWAEGRFFKCPNGPGSFVFFSLLCWLILGYSFFFLIF